MGVISKSLLAGVMLFWLRMPSVADDLPPLPPVAKQKRSAIDPKSTDPVVRKSAENPKAATAESRTRVTSPAKNAEPAPKVSSAGKGAATSDEEVTQLRTETADRLAKLPKSDDKDATTASKALREVLEERVKWLDDWDKAVKERVAAENPEQSPEKQAAEWKADLERITTSLEQTAKDPDSLLPVTFRKLPTEVPDTLRNELKETIDSAQNELKDWSSKREQARSNPSRKEGGDLAALRAARDQTFRRVAGLKARSLEREAAVDQAKSSEARDMAREKLLNFQWESRVETERLRGQESRLTLETKRSDLLSLNLQLQEAHVQLAGKTLDRMKGRYSKLAARQERELKTEAVKEQSRAANSDDPLERYRAKRTADLLELKAKVLKSQDAWTTDPSPSLVEQKAKADHAETDYDNVKKLLDDGKISHLDALRLNNDFRRIGTERDVIVRNELAIAANRLTLAENALSNVELDLINDARDDRYELDTLLQSLPRSLQARAITIFQEIEQKHMDLLTRERDALQKLASRSEQTHEQILRRIKILDDHFGFIRTHMFWVRDEEPIGLQALPLVQREGRQIFRAGLAILALAVDPKSWGRVSPEFLIAAFGLVVFPWPFYRARRALRALALGQDVPPSPEI